MAVERTNFVLIEKSPAPNPIYKPANMAGGGRSSRLVLPRLATAESRHTTPTNIGFIKPSHSCTMCRRRVNSVRINERGHLCVAWRAQLRSRAVREGEEKEGETRRKGRSEGKSSRSYAFVDLDPGWRGSWKAARARPINEPDELRYLDLVTSRSSLHFREFCPPLRFRFRSRQSSIQNWLLFYIYVYT